VRQLAILEFSPEDISRDTKKNYLRGTGMEGILGNTGPALQFMNSLLENFEIGLQRSVLYSEPLFFLLRTAEKRGLADFKVNGSQTNPYDVIFQKRELSAVGSIYSFGDLRLWGRNDGRYRLLGCDSGQLYRSFGRRFSKLLPSNTAWRTIRRRSFLPLMCVLHTRTQPSATESYLHLLP